MRRRGRIRNLETRSNSLILVRTWSGSYVGLSRVHLAIAGWLRYWWSRIA